MTTTIGKFVLLSKLLPKLYDGGHKVLIFSQMVRVLDLLQELLQLKHYKYERLDGSTSASARNAAVDRFRRESFKRFVMLLSTRAGGEIQRALTAYLFSSILSMIRSSQYSCFRSGSELNGSRHCHYF